MMNIDTGPQNNMPLDVFCKLVVDECKKLRQLLDMHIKLEEHYRKKYITLQNKIKYFDAGCNKS